MNASASWWLSPLSTGTTNLEKLFNSFSAQCLLEQLQRSHDEEVKTETLTQSLLWRLGEGGLIYPKPRLFFGKVPFYSLFKIHAPVASLMLQPVVKNLHAKLLHLNISQSCLARSSYIRPTKALTINSGGLIVYCFGYQSINLIDLIDLY